VLPRFPNLSTLDLDGNSIGSLQPIVDRIKNKNDKACFVSNTLLRTLNLYWNPIMYKVKESPEVEAALLSFLETYNTISNLGTHNYGSDVEYALRINHAGQGILEGGCCVRYIPLSVWPIVLARAYDRSDKIYGSKKKKKKKNHTGLHYLLRNGPALIKY